MNVIIITETMKLKNKLIILFIHFLTDVSRSDLTHDDKTLGFSAHDGALYTEDAVFISGKNDYL